MSNPTPNSISDSPRRAHRQRREPGWSGILISAAICFLGILWFMTSILSLSQSGWSSPFVGIAVFAAAAYFAWRSVPRFLAIGLFLLAVANVGFFVYRSFSGPSPLTEQHFNVAFDVSPDGKQIVFASVSADLFLLDLNTKQVRQLTDSDLEEMTPSYSPDGKSILFSAKAGSTTSSIFSIDLDGKNRQQLTRGQDTFDSSPRFSSDGKQITFIRAHQHRPYSMGGWTWDKWDVYTMDASGDQVLRITNKNFYGSQRAQFAKDGHRLFFSADHGRKKGMLFHNLFEVPADGSAEPTEIPPQAPVGGTFGAWASDPGISPDGNSIVVISDRVTPYRYDLVMIDLTRSTATSLNATSVSTYNQNPVFSPDGKKIYFLAGTESNVRNQAVYSLWSIDLDGKNAREIADWRLFSNPLNWVPK
jgi:Tol biopolymer transport system component